MKTKLLWLMLCFMFTTSTALLAQQIPNKPQGPVSVNKPTSVVQVPSIASRMNNLVIADLSEKKEMEDGRSSIRKSKVQVVIGKGSKGDDELAKKQRNTKQVPARMPELVFETLASNSQPTDPSGAVGPNHYFAVINTAIRIFDKSGNPLTGQLDPVPAIFPTDLNYCCDLTVSYDNNADRWVVSILSFSQGSSVAVSNGPDPVNDSWTVYTYGVVNDYQKLSVWTNGYYMTENTGLANKVHVFEREKMLTGDPAAQIISFQLPGFETPTPVTFHSPQVLNLSTDDATTTNATVIYHQDDAWAGVTDPDHIKLWTIDVDWDNTGNSTVSAATKLGVDAGTGTVTPFISVFDGGFFDNLTQPGGQDIDALQGIIMNQAQFRKFGSHNSALINFVVDTDGGAGELAGVRWYELRQSGDGQPWTIYQEGTYIAPDGRHAWNASMIMDLQGNIGMGYTSMSGPDTPTTVRVGSYYTGQLVGSSGSGTMNVAEEVIMAGDANIPGSERYGDYSKIDIDPANDKKFWFVNELMQSGRKNVAGVFQLAPNSDNDVGVVSIDTPIDGALSNSETVTVTVFNFGENDASGFDIRYQVDGSGVITETFPGTLASQTSQQFVFSTTADMSNEGTSYLITACTVYDADEDNNNDCVSSNVLHVLADDIGVTAITSPVSGESLGTESVSITIENFGTADQTGFDVSYSIDGGTPVIETVGDNVPAGGSITYDFNQMADLSEFGTYEFAASTLLGTDGDNSNDMIMSTVVNVSCISGTNDNPANIPDNGGETLSIISIGNSFNVEDVNVTIDVTHGYVGDLEIKLIAPDGITEVMLVASDLANGGVNYTNTTFDDQATTSITDGTPPYTGTFRPQGNLSDFNGLSSFGDWTLSILDTFLAIDDGVLNSWTLQVCGDIPDVSNDIGITAITSPVSAEGLGSETVTVTISNFGDQDQSGFDVSYSLDGNTPIVETVGDNVPALSSISYDFSQTVDLSAIDAYNLMASTLLGNDEDTSNDAFTVSVVNFSCQDETNSTSQNVGPDSGMVTESIITIDDDFPIDDINVTVDITHAYIGDLAIKLIAPDGITEVTLVSANVANDNENYTDTTFDDQATTPIANGPPPYTGVFKPEGSLADFNGMSSMGDWTLSITDNFADDGGTLNSWSIEYCGNTNLSLDDNLFDSELKVIHLGDRQYDILLPTSSANDRLQMRIYNLLGQVLLYSTLDNETGDGYKYRLDMSYASSGVYVIEVNNRNVKSVKRFIVE